MINGLINIVNSILLLFKLYLLYQIHDLFWKCELVCVDIFVHNFKGKKQEFQFLKIVHIELPLRYSLTFIFNIAKQTNVCKIMINSPLLV